MDSKKYIGMDVHKESISIAVMNGAGKIGMEFVIETKASMILQFFGGLDRFLPPFFGIDSFVFPSFLNPQNALLTQPLYVLSTTYQPKFPSALQYNLNLEREIGRGAILTAGYFGARGNHLTRQTEQNPRSREFRDASNVGAQRASDDRTERNACAR